jgi:hypothetical protein
LYRCCAFLARISPEKGVTTAVRISEAGGFEILVAAKVAVTKMAKRR